jgi:hypothetical protein
MRATPRRPAVTGGGRACDKLVWLQTYFKMQSRYADGTRQERVQSERLRSGEDLGEDLGAHLTRVCHTANTAAICLKRVTSALAWRKVRACRIVSPSLFFCLLFPACCVMPNAGWLRTTLGIPFRSKLTRIPVTGTNDCGRARVAFGLPRLEWRGFTAPILPR